MNIKTGFCIFYAEAIFNLQNHVTMEVEIQVVEQLGKPSLFFNQYERTVRKI